jgi:hypothetical protein
MAQCGVIVPRGTNPRLRTQSSLRRLRKLICAAPSGLRRLPKRGAARHALGGDRARCRVIPIHNVKQRSLLRSRGAFLRPGFAFLFSIHPDEGRAERRKAQYFCCRAFRRATIRACRGAARVQRDALASRRSTVAIFGRGPRFHLRHFFRICAASSSQPGRCAWRAGSRTSRGLGYEPRPQDATPRSAFGTSPETAPQMSEDMRFVAYSR